MRSIALALAVLLGAGGAGCDDVGPVDGTRGPCAGTGEVLGCDDEVVTIEDACWKLVQCGVIPLDHPDRDEDWGGCVDLLERHAATAEVSIACVDLASCDELTLQGSPTNPYPWPDCLEFE
jgi:hypothetical protein